MKSLLALCLLTLALSGCAGNYIQAEVFIKAETDCTMHLGLDYVTVAASVTDTNNKWWYTAHCKDGSSVYNKVEDQ